MTGQTIHRAGVFHRKTIIAVAIAGCLAVGLLSDVGAWRGRTNTVYAAPAAASITVPGDFTCDIPTPNPAPICGSQGNHLTVNVTGGVSPFTFSWSVSNADPGWQITAGADTDTITYTAGNAGPASGANFNVVIFDDVGGETFCMVHLRCAMTPLECQIQIPPPGTQPDCGSDGNTLVALVTGGNGPFGFAWTLGVHDPGWAITAGADTDTITYSAGPPNGNTGTGADFLLTVTDADGTTSECTIHVRCTPTATGQGCTPGFWKQSQHFDNWTAPYVPSMKFKDACANGHCLENAFGNKSLLTVLSQPGSTGGTPQLNALGRHTVAALLNAASGINFGLTPQQVIDKFNAVFPGTNDAYTDLKDEFADLNQQGCPY